MLVLVVDDVATERLHTGAVVKAAGHTPIEAVNGEEALKMAMLHKPAAVIMDIVMPVMDGFAALKRMTNNPELAHIPVIIVSSKRQESDKKRGEMLGSKGWLVKPVVGEELQALLLKLI